MEEDLKIEKRNEVFSMKNFQNYRNNNDENQKDTYIIKNEERRSVPNENCISIGGGDSAYYSGCSYLSSPHSSILSSSQFSTNSVASLNLTKSSNFHQHSESISEYPTNSKKEHLTLTPVTQNAQRISAFHITTPKNEQEQSIYINKRSSNNLLEEFQSTPKRFKHCDYDIYSTPQKHKKRKTNLFQRLHSAPDIESITNEEEIVLWKTPVQSTPKRTPLHTVQENNCTPIYLSVKRNSTINENSVNELLNCSNDIFDSILNSDSRNSSKCRKSASNKKLIQNNENFQPDSCLQHNSKNSCRTFRRFLKFNSQNNTSATNKDNSKIEQQTTITSTTTLGISSKRRSYPAIHSVIHDRLKAKKRVNAERLANLNRQNSFEISQNDTIFFELEAKNDFSSNSKNKKNSSVDKKSIDMVISPVESITKINKISLIQTPNKLEKSFNMEISPPTDLAKNLASNVEIADMDISLISTNLKLKTIKDLQNKKSNDSIFDLESKGDIFLDDIIPLTPPPYTFENIRNDEYNNLSYNNSNLEEEKNIHKTPPRKSSRSSSTSSQKSSICVFDKEKFKILYPTIPETPKKYVVTVSPKKLSPKKKKNTIKNKKHTDRTFYNGSTYLNIISKLEPYTIVLERIFYYLSDKDLLNLSMTTKVYRTIIQDNYKANLRLIKFIRDYKVRKENYCKQSQFNKNEKSDSLYKNNNINSKVKPFSLHNEKCIRKRNSEIELKQKVLNETSPPVSPSKQKFHEYQKIIKNLPDQQTMAKCPRCAMASRIINQPPLDLYPELESINELSNEMYNNNNNNIETRYDAILKYKSNENNFEVDSNFDNNLNKNQPQSYLTNEIQQRSISEIRRFSLIQQSSSQNLNLENKMKLKKAFSVDSWQGQLRKQRLLNEISIFQPYGECTSIRCKFKYCLECFCDYHPKKKCKLTAPVSPSKEDIQNGILQIIKSPKKSGSISNSKSVNNNGSRSLNMKRKSLKRLCFN